LVAADAVYYDLSYDQTIENAFIIVVNNDRNYHKKLIFLNKRRFKRGSYNILNLESPNQMFNKKVAFVT
jgi:hypothetical protein